MLCAGVAVTLRVNSTVVFQGAFTVVWCPKHQHPAIGGRMEQRLKEIICEVVDAKGAWPAGRLLPPGR